MGGAIGIRLPEDVAAAVAQAADLLALREAQQALAAQFGAWKPRNPLSSCSGPEAVTVCWTWFWYIYPTEPQRPHYQCVPFRIPPVSHDGIEYLDVLPLLRGAITTFAGSVESAAVDLDNGEYVNITHLVRHLIGRLAVGRTEDFPAVFAVRRTGARRR